MHLPDTIEHIATADLVPYARNSRTHSIEQVGKVADSIRRFGFTNPVLVRGSMIVAGHGRVMAAKALDMATVPVIRLDHLSEDEARAYVIADNKLAELAGWDDEALALELKDLQAHDFDLGLVGFTSAEINALLGGQDGHDSGAAGAAPTPFNYQEKYAVLVGCKDEQDQAAAYERLTGLGYACKVLVN